MRKTASRFIATILPIRIHWRAMRFAPCSSIRADRVWVGTSDAGVDILDPASGRIEHLRKGTQAGTSLSSDGVFTLAQADSGDVVSAPTRGSICGTRTRAR